MWIEEMNPGKPETVLGFQPGKGWLDHFFGLSFRILELMEAGSIKGVIIDVESLSETQTGIESGRRYKCSCFIIEGF